MPKIIDGICDCADVCEKKDCPYYHSDVESIKRYIKMLGEEAAFPFKKYPRQKPPDDCPLTV